MTVHYHGSTALAIPAPKALARRPPQRALTAAATRIDLTEKTRRKVNRADWQATAWHYFDELPLVGVAGETVGNAHSRCTLFAGERDNPDDEPRPTEDPDAIDVVNELGRGLKLAMGRGAPLTGQPALLAGIAVNKFVAGQCYLVGTKADGGTTWDLLSVLEVDWRGGIAYRLTGGAPEEIRGDEIFIDLYKPHPARRRTPTSSVYKVRNACARLEAIGHAITAITNSHRNAGVVLMDESVQLPNVSDDPSEEPEDDPFTRAWMDYFTAAIRDPQSAASVVPPVFRADMSGGRTPESLLHHFSFGRELEETMLRLHAETTIEIATALDLPTEKLSADGLTGINHWGQWEVGERFVTEHVGPSLTETCDDLTAAYMWPELEIRGKANREKFCIWWSDTALTVRPDRSGDAIAVYDRGEIGGEALRRETGFTDTDVPTPEELAARGAREAITTGGTQRRPQPAVEGPPGSGPDAPPPGSTSMGATSTKEVVERMNAVGIAFRSGFDPEDAARYFDIPIKHTGAVPVTVKEPTDDTPALTPPPAKPAPPPPALTAAATPPNPRLARLSADLHARDVRLMERLAAAADAEVRRALEKAGAKLRSAVAGDPRHASAKAALRDVANTHVAQHLGPERVRAFGLAEDRILEESLAGYLGRAHRWLSAAQEDALRRIAAEVDDLDPDEVAAHTEPERRHSLTAAMALLSAGLLHFARDRLYDPTPAAPKQGEWDDLLAPRRVLRDSMTTAGGGDPAVPGPGGVAQGETAMDVLRGVGIDAVAYEWVWGGSARPFEPHVELNGRRFEDFGELENNESFPATGLFYPGDHEGDSCSVITVLAERAVEVAA